MSDIKDCKSAVCRLFTHQFGWELRLAVNGGLTRSAVCRAQDDVFSTFEGMEDGDDGGRAGTHHEILSRQMPAVWRGRQ